jgi:hypothetical protein
MPQQGKKKADAILVMTLACGATVEAAAAKAGVAEATVYRRLSNPEFKRRVDTAQAEMIGRTMAMLTASAGEAVKTLLALMREDVQAPVRLGAARATLEIGMKLREVHDMQARIAALEAELQPGPRLANGTES